MVEQERRNLPGHLRSSPMFSRVRVDQSLVFCVVLCRSLLSGVRVARSLVLYICFVDRCLSFCTFSFGHCVICSSSMDVDCLFGIFKLLSSSCNLLFAIVLFVFLRLKLPVTTLVSSNFS